VADRTSRLVEPNTHLPVSAIMKRLRNDHAFSFLEVIAAVVILSVVSAATVATVAPMRARSDQRLVEQQAASLSSMSQTYFLEQGLFPPEGVPSLIAAGYLANTDTEAQSLNARLRRDFSYNPATGVFTRK